VQIYHNKTQIDNNIRADYTSPPVTIFKMNTPSLRGATIGMALSLLTQCGAPTVTKSPESRRARTEKVAPSSPEEEPETIVQNENPDPTATSPEGTQASAPQQPEENSAEKQEIESLRKRLRTAIDVVFTQTKRITAIVEKVNQKSDEEKAEIETRMNQNCTKLTKEASEFQEKIAPILEKMKDKIKACMEKTESEEEHLGCITDAILEGSPDKNEKEAITKTFEEQAVNLTKIADCIEDTMRSIMNP
jgi:hypothetical protein